jgi:hypothetical protein
MTKRLAIDIAAVLAASVAHMSACVPPDEPLPPVRQQTLFPAPPQPCAIPPRIRTELRPLLAKPSDPGRCLNKMSLRRILATATPRGNQDRKSLPILLTVAADGRVAVMTFYDQCTGSEYRVDRDTVACLQAAFATWQFTPDAEGCPGYYYMQENWYSVRVGAASAESRAGVSTPSAACGG